MLVRTPSRRAGFTLIELLVSLVMLAVVGNAILAMMVAMQRITRQQSETAALQGNLRTGMQLLQGELVELAAGDITTMANDKVGYRAMRGLGETCEVTTASVKLRRSTYGGLRGPTADRDGLWLYLDADTTQSNDDQWKPFAMTAVATSTCPDGSDAWRLTVALSAADSASAGVPGPVRTYEDMEIGQVQEDGLEWLGIRSIGFGETSLVPVSGPVAWNGVRFAYRDLNDAATTNPAEVETIRVTLRGVTERPVGVNAGGAYSRSDSLLLRIRLRN